MLEQILGKLLSIEETFMSAIEDIATLGTKIDTLGGKVDNLVHLFGDQKAAIEDMKAQVTTAVAAASAAAPTEPAIDITPLFEKLDKITGEIDGTLNPEPKPTA